MYRLFRKQKAVAEEGATMAILSSIGQPTAHVEDPAKVTG
jgi:hypothetical protein